MFLHTSRSLHDDTDTRGMFCMFDFQCPRATSCDKFNKCNKQETKERNGGSENEVQVNYETTVHSKKTTQKPPEINCDICDDISEMNATTTTTESTTTPTTKPTTTTEPTTTTATTEATMTTTTTEPTTATTMSSTTTESTTTTTEPTTSTTEPTTTSKPTTTTTSTTTTDTPMTIEPIVFVPIECSVCERTEAKQERQNGSMLNTSGKINSIYESWQAYTREQ